MKSIRLFVIIAAAGLSAAAQPAGDATVIRIRYHCAQETCAAAVTRAEFDALVQALDPAMSEAGRQSLAAEYTRVLIMAAEARSRGLHRSPEFATLEKFSTLQLLAMRLVREMNTAAPPPASTEIEAYYRDHSNDFQTVTLSRLQVPAQPNHAGDGPGLTAARADAIRRRAVAGEDFAALQHELSGAADTPRQLGPVPCLTLPEALRPLCALDRGEISQPYPDGPAYAIYRLESRRERSLEEVREEIALTLGRVRVQQAIESARTPVSIDLEESYFGKLPGGELAHKHGMSLPRQ